MPKTKKRREGLYTEENLRLALDAIKTHKMSFRMASKMFGVPTTTLHLKSQEASLIQIRKGPPTIFTTAEEQQLVEWILFLGERGFPVTRTQLVNSVQQLAIKLGKTTPFTNNKPGRHWYEGFLRRHKTLSCRIAQNLSKTRASVSEIQLRRWFAEVEDHLKRLDILEIEASRIYNCDESPFLLCPKPDQVIARRGTKTVYKVVNADEKECLTTLFMVNAEGSALPPMIMYSYKRLPQSILREFPRGWQIGLSEKGWMTAESFYEYITNCFYPWLINNSIKFPIILYVDGHSSHLTLPLVEFCRRVQIELIALFPNATHILQPLDVAVFHPLKKAWKETVNAWRWQNDGEKLKKEQFAPLLGKALESINLTETIKNGFKACGLMPFSPNSVNYNIFNKNKNQGQDEHIQEKDDESEKFREHLRFFESNLDEGILEMFMSANERKESIDERNQGLFAYWQKMKKRCGEKTIENATSFSSTREEIHEQEEVLSEKEMIDPIEKTVFDLNEESEKLKENFIVLELDDIATNLLETQEMKIQQSDDGFRRIINFAEHSEIQGDTLEIVDDISTLTRDFSAPIALELIDTEQIEESIEKADDGAGQNLQEIMIDLNSVENLNETKTLKITATNQEINNNDDHLSTVAETLKHEQKDENVPPTFKDFLFWPQNKEKIPKKKKVKIPSVATSDEWLKYHTEKQKIKEEKQAKIEENRKKREEVKKIKKEETERMRSIKSEAKELKKEELAKKKRMKAQPQQKKKIKRNEDNKEYKYTNVNQSIRM